MSNLGLRLAENGFQISEKQDQELAFYEGKLVEFMNYGSSLDEELLEAVTALKSTAEFQRVQSLKKDKKLANIFITSMSDQYKGATKFVLADYMTGLSLEQKLRSLNSELNSNPKQLISKKQKLIGA